MRPVSLLLASSNQGKLREYLQLAGGANLEIRLFPDFSAVPAFEESAPTFAENATGKALYYSRITSGTVLADDSGLVVPALGGAPGVHSARYAGPQATDADCAQKLLLEMEHMEGSQRRARFVCVIVVARRGRALAVVSDFVDGCIAPDARGASGFGYDPVFVLPALDRTFAQLSGEEKNQYSHRGRAFAKVCDYLFS